MTLWRLITSIFRAPENIDAWSPSAQYRQGNLLFMSRRAIPQHCAIRAEGLIDRDELTGYAHRLVGGVVHEQNGRIHLEAGPKAHFIHEEHEPLELPQGLYVTVRQREYRGENDWNGIAVPFSDRGPKAVVLAQAERLIYSADFFNDDALIEDEDREYPEDRSGVWLLLSKGPASFSIYRGEWGPSHTDTSLAEPFAVVDPETMRRCCEERALGRLLAAPDDRSVLRSPGEWAALLAGSRVEWAMITAVKLEMSWPLISADILQVDNQELRMRALDVFGRERLVAEADAEVVARSGKNELLRVHDMLFVHLNAPSTPRRRFIRVPAQWPRPMLTVHEAIAWTFGFMTPEDYAPVRET